MYGICLDYFKSIRSGHYRNVACQCGKNNLINHYIIWQSKLFGIPSCFLPNKFLETGETFLLGELTRLSNATIHHNGYAERALLLWYKTDR